MSLETGTYISDLVETNPTASDPKSQGDDHLRLIKACVKATFPNITGAVTPTHTELNYVDGVTSAIQTQLDAKGAITGQAWTGSHTFPTQTAADNSTKAATTAYVDAADALKANLASPALTGTPTAPTASGGTNTTQIATTAFVVQQAFSTALPAQSGNAGKFLTTDGSSASWSTLSAAPDVIVQDQRTSGTAAGAAGGTRTLNTVVRNQNSIATLSANAVTLPAGTYYIEAWGTFSSAGGATSTAAIQIVNSTDSANVGAQGSPVTCPDNGVVLGGGRSESCGVVTIAGSKAFTIQNARTGSPNGGLAISSGSAEVYGQMRIWKTA